MDNGWSEQAHNVILCLTIVSLLNHAKLKFTLVYSKLIPLFAEGTWNRVCQKTHLKLNVTAIQTVYFQQQKTKLIFDSVVKHNVDLELILKYLHKSLLNLRLFWKYTQVTNGEIEVQ